MIFLDLPDAVASFKFLTEAKIADVQYLRHRERHDINQALDFELSTEFVFNNEKNFRFVAKPRLIVDAHDFSRNRYLPQELFLEYYMPRFDVRAGMMLVPLGFAESFNPTDILNRPDLERNYYEPESLGEIGLSAAVHFNLGALFNDATLRLIVLPFFQNTPLPDSDTRFALSGSQNGLRYSLVEPSEETGFMKSVAAALVLSSRVGRMDVEALVYNGPEHDPGYRLVIDDRGALRLRPFYYSILMTGISARMPVGRFVLKAEAAYKNTSFNDFVGHDIQPVDESAIPESSLQFVAGGDYTLHSFIHKSELRLFVEYLGENNISDSYRSFRPFKRDVAAGFLWTLNDNSNTSIKFALIKDVATRETIIKSEAGTALYKALRAQAKILYVIPASAPSPLSFFDNNSSVMAGLGYSFGKAW